VHMVSTGSLEYLNQKLAEINEPPMKINRFRPNIVLESKIPHLEDHLRYFSLGDCILETQNLMGRCAVT